VRALRFAIGLLVALLVHLFVVVLGPEAAGAVDPFLLLIVLFALDGNVLAALIGGCVAGLTEDAVTGGLFGLYGLAGTVVGFVAARTTHQLSLERRRFVALLFSLAAVIQQMVVQGMLVLLNAEQEMPSLTLLAIRVVLAAVFGSMLVTAWGKAESTLRKRRQDHRPRVSWGTK
jgi:rod shape-determining protein MreD